MRGIPQFFYGDEIVASHPGTSSHGELRSDFPGGWDGDTVNAYTGEGLTEKQRDAQQLVRTLLNWRKNNSTIHHGKFMHFAPIGNVYVYFRYDADLTIMVILNRDEETVALDTGRFAERIGDATHGTDVVTGQRFNIEDSLVLEPRSALLLELER
jgi:glycosidase